MISLCDDHVSMLILEYLLSLRDLRGYAMCRARAQTYRGGSAQFPLGTSTKLLCS